jgi:hypothetical protein
MFSVMKNDWYYHMARKDVINVYLPEYSINGLNIMKLISHVLLKSINYIQTI